MTPLSSTLSRPLLAIGIILAVHFSASPTDATRFPRTTCKYVLTNDTRESVLSVLNAHAVQVSALPDVRSGSAPRIMLHPAGSCVHGTVILFHGFTENAWMLRLQARYLFRAGFNVYGVNLASFAQTEKHWIRVKLRATKGYATARRVLLSDPRMKRALAVAFGPMWENTTFVTEQMGGPGRLLPTLRHALSDAAKSSTSPVTKTALRDALTAVSVLVPPSKFAKRPLQVQRFDRFFTSGVARFQAEPLARIAEVQALPGPLFATGFSLGASNVLNAIGGSAGAVRRTVLLAPYFPGDRTEILLFQSVAASFGLVPRLAIGPLSAPSQAVAASYVAAAIATRDAQTSVARRTTDVLCVMAEVDSFIDVPTSKKLCNGKLGGRTVMYPARFGLDHFITPEYSSPYGDALMEQMVQFFLTGKVDRGRFLRRNEE